MEPIREIAKTLRCTDKMAEAFVQSVREKIGQDAPDETILAVVSKLPPRSINIAKVVAGVRQELNKRSRRPARRRAAKAIRSTTNPGLPRPIPREPDKPAQAGQPSSRPRHARRPAAGGTLLDVLEEILSANWSRAEQEGLRPERLSGAEFIRAVHLHCHPRDATRSRIVRACKKIDRQDVIITPPLVADIIREEA
jgi:hypothetical protein